MLSPEARTVATDILRPPAGYKLDQAVITTYSLDLDVILALPLAVLAQSDQGIDELLGDPMLILEALREAGGRLDIFVDAASIAIPHSNRALYTMLEDCVHPVRAPNGGAFHPKLWAVQFTQDNGPPLMRVAVMSRNLTYDRSWDAALVTEALLGSTEGPVDASAPLGELLRALPGAAVHGVGAEREAILQGLAEQLERTAFPAPDRFKSPLNFEVLGLQSGTTAPWHPGRKGQNALAIAPFVNRTGLDAIAARSAGERTLISRREALDDLPESALRAWQDVLVLSEAALDEDQDGQTQSSDLHAKIFALEHGRRVTWYMGSANFTAAALTGRNVEVIVSMSGPRDERAKTSGYGISQFKEAGFLKLCEPYDRAEPFESDSTIKAAKERLELARRALALAQFELHCAGEGNAWQLTLDGDVDIPSDVDVQVWPVSLKEDQSVELKPDIAWSLPLDRLTAFIAFRLRADAEVDDVRFVLKLPATGMPEGRVAQVLRHLINTPERFLQFLRALLGGLEGLVGWAQTDDGGRWEGDWGAGLNAEPLLEDLVRAAARDPSRLAPIRRLIHDLQSSPNGKSIVPEDFLAIWDVVDAVVDQGSKR
ncbi:phospholipase D family protein [Wenzhouxiangella sp. EGI_FJ10409]|uniref:phospholipase D family protein n=1 Tax=Wenzhouxiangella sp. EGI_FJ10409 TaxID=3243767 RepID=UPI0035DE2F8F